MHCGKFIHNSYNMIFVYLPLKDFSITWANYIKHISVRCIVHSIYICLIGMNHGHNIRGLNLVWMNTAYAHVHNLCSIILFCQDMVNSSSNEVNTLCI